MQKYIEKLIEANKRFQQDQAELQEKLRKEKEEMNGEVKQIRSDLNEITIRY